MIDKLQILEEILEAMLTEDITISARGAVRQSEGVFKNPTDLTRIPDRAAKLDHYAKLQATLRNNVGRSNGSSIATLRHQLELKRARIEDLEQDVETLIASHRAMILVIAESGGFDRWKAFFAGYEATIDRLNKLAALPSATVRPIREN